MSKDIMHYCINKYLYTFFLKEIMEIKLWHDCWCNSTKAYNNKYYASNFKYYIYIYIIMDKILFAFLKIS